MLCFVLNSLGSGEGGGYAEFLGWGVVVLGTEEVKGKTTHTRREGPGDVTAALNNCQLRGRAPSEQRNFPHARAPALRKINSAAQP